MTQAEIAILVVQALVKYGPELATSVHGILTSADPTDDEIKAMLALSQKPYEAYIAEAQARQPK